MEDLITTSSDVQLSSTYTLTETEVLTYERLEPYLQVYVISIGIVIGFLMVLCIAKGWDSNGI